jgi:hypothetical protein
MPWAGELPPRKRGRIYASPEETREIEGLEITLVDWDIYEHYGSITRELGGEFLCASLHYLNRGPDVAEVPVPLTVCNGAVREAKYVLPIALLRYIPAGREQRVPWLFEVPREAGQLQLECANARGVITTWKLSVPTSKPE